MPLLKPSRAIQLNRSHPLTRGLAACWLFNEGTGSQVFDASGNGNIGTLEAQTCRGAGLFGPHLNFDGSNDYVDCGVSDFGIGLTNEVSLLAWIRPKNGGSSTQTLCQRGQYIRPFGLTITNSTGQAKWIIRTSDTSYLSSPIGLISIGEWVQIVGTYRNGEQRIYIDGVLQNNDTTTGTLNAGDYATTLARTPNGTGNWFSGDVDHVMIFNRCLSAGEIARLYCEPFAMFDKGIRPALLFIPTVVSVAGSVNAQTNASAKLSESISSSLLTERSWFTDALFNGMTANAFKLGTILSQGWFWTRTAGCSALYRGSNIDKMDFANILTVAAKNCCNISPPEYLPHNSDTTYFYVVRRFNNCGYPELTLAASVKVPIDADGELEKPQPNKVFASRNEQTSCNKIQLNWFYNPIEQKSPPKCFNIYYDNGMGLIDYENPLATISYKGQRFYSYQSEELQAGRYLFAIKTQDADGTENQSSAQLSIQLDLPNPSQIEILNAESL